MILRINVLKHLNLFRTSPEEFMQRLSIVEENNASESSTNEVKGRDFSMPAPPKSAVKAGTQPSMMRDKVRGIQCSNTGCAHNFWIGI